MSKTELRHLGNQRLERSDEVAFSHAIKTCFLLDEAEIKGIVTMHSCCVSATREQIINN